MRGGLPRPRRPFVTAPCGAAARDIACRCQRDVRFLMRSSSNGCGRNCRRIPRAAGDRSPAPARRKNPPRRLAPARGARLRRRASAAALARSPSPRPASRGSRIRPPRACRQRLLGRARLRARDPATRDGHRVGAGSHRVQPLHVDDLARAVAELLEATGPVPPVLDLGGPAPMTTDDLTHALRAWLGLLGAPFPPVPAPLLRLAAASGDAACRARPSRGRASPCSRAATPRMRGRWRGRCVGGRGPRPKPSPPTRRRRPTAGTRGSCPCARRCGSASRRCGSGRVWCPPSSRRSRTATPRSRASACTAPPRRP